MLLTEYTAERKNILNKLNISHAEFPFGLRLLWCDSIGSAEAPQLITAQNHSHTFFEIFLTFHGEVTYICSGENITLQEGYGVVVSPDTDHCFVTGSEGFLRVSVAFSLEEANELAAALSEVPFRTFEISRETVNNMDHILRQCERRTLFSVQMAAGRLLEMIYDICENMKVLPNLPEEDPSDPRVYVAKQYIERNRHRLIRGEEVARECCLSVKQLNRIMKEDTGKSVGEYIAQERMRLAKYLLLYTEDSIKEISFSMGFENESSFTSFFRRNCGEAPSVYRSRTPEQLMKETVQNVPE